MQEVFRDGRPDRIRVVNKADIGQALAEAVGDPAVQSVTVHKPGSVVTVTNGPFKGRRYRINDLGQRVRVRG